MRDSVRKDREESPACTRTSSMQKAIQFAFNNFLPCEASKRVLKVGHAFVIAVVEKFSKYSIHLMDFT